MARHLLCWMVLGLVVALAAPVYADGIWWEDTAGTTVGAPLAATWDNLQTAIVAAQGGGGGGRGEVRINGNVTRTAGDVNVSLSVAAGGKIDVGGGWDATYTTQTASTRATLDCQSNNLATKGRVMDVSAPNVVLDNLWLKNGRTQAGTGLNVGGGGSGLRVTDSIISDNAQADVNGVGVSIIDVNDVKISRTIIANNGGARVGGGGVYVNNAGEEATPVVLEYCHIAQNYGGDHSSGVVSGVYATGTSHLTIANSRFYNNNVNGYADAIYTTAEKTIVFGTLFDDHNREHWGTYRPVIRNSSYSEEGLVLANCSVVDNGPDWIQSVSTGGSGDVNSTVLVNTLVGVTDPTSTTDSHAVGNWRRSYSQGYLPHMLLQNSSFSADADPPTNTTFVVEGASGPVVAQDLAAAFSTMGPWGRYRFHALDPLTGAVLPNPQAGANQEEDIAFVLADDLTGATPADRAYLYSLEPGTPSTFSGTTQTGVGYVYVDIDHDGVFDPTLDVVVSGVAPGSALYVYDYDLSVLGRVTRSGAAYTIEPDTVLGEGLSALALGYASNRYPGGIDRGAYQSVGLPIPEPGTLGLLLLGLPALMKRRRTRRSRSAMRRYMFGVIGLVLILALAVPATAGSVWWQDTAGTPVGAPLAGTWDNVQAAIVAAQGGGGGGRGAVRIEGDIARTAGDVNVSLDVSATGKIDVSGGWNAAFTVQTASTRSTLDSASNTLLVDGRVMKVDAPSVTVDNVWLKNGYNTSGVVVHGAGIYVGPSASGFKMSDSIVSDSRNDIGGPQASGGGVHIEGANNVTLSNMIISDNRCAGHYQQGGRGLSIRNAGTEAEPIIVEYSHISDNAGGSYSRGYGSGMAAIGTSHVMVANSRITDNAEAREGSAIYSTAQKVILFGTLIDASGERNEAVRASGPLGSPESFVMANCTVVDNDAARSTAVVEGVSTDGGGRTNVNSVVLINSLVGVTDPDSAALTHLVSNTRRSYSQGYLPNMLLQNSTFSADTDPQVNTTFGVEGTGGVPQVLVADLSDALSTLDTWGNYRFHSLDSAGAILPNPALGANQEEDIAFVLADDLTGATPADRAYQYSLESGTPSTFSGTTQTGAGYVYVDIDHDGVFDPTLDVVVSGAAFAPGGALYVYDYDLSVLGRVTRSGAAYVIEPDTVLGEGLSALALGYAPNRYLGGIDRGAYQSAALPIPEPATLGLLLLGLPLLRRRRRT